MSSEIHATCSECGATMLAATAIRTGGICMACKQGIRKNIEAAKIYYRQQRQPDPFRDYWIELVHRVFDVPDGFYRLPHREQTYFLGCVFEGEIYNGGTQQFFSNSSGNLYRETLDSLQALGAIRCRTLLVAAKEILFPFSNPPVNQAERLRVMPKWPKEPSAPRPAWDLALDPIDDEIYGDPDKLGDRLRSYALNHQLVKI